MIRRHGFSRFAFTVDFLGEKNAGLLRVIADRIQRVAAGECRGMLNGIYELEC
mgnify:CR=1 FL=1